MSLVFFTPKFCVFKVLESVVTTLTYSQTTGKKLSKVVNFAVYLPPLQYMSLISMMYSFNNIWHLIFLVLKCACQ